MAIRNDEARARAEARFKVAETRSAEAVRYKADRDQQLSERDANTARLKALRLAKEAESREAELAAEPKPAAKRKRAAQPRRTSA